MSDSRLAAELSVQLTVAQKVSGVAAITLIKLVMVSLRDSYGFKVVQAKQKTHT